MTIYRKRPRSIVVLERIIIIKLKRSNRRSKKRKGLRKRRELWSRNSSSFGAIEDACVTFGSLCVWLRCVQSRIVLIHSPQMCSHSWEERPNSSEQMGNRCLTVAVDSGATPKTGGITKPQRGAQKADDPISLHTCISEEVQKQLADTSFVEKEEAREVGLCRGVHLGLQMPEKSNTVL